MRAVLTEFYLLLSALVDNNTRERLNSQIKNLKSRVKDDGMNLAKRNKEYIESTDLHISSFVLSG